MRLLIATNLVLSVLSLHAQNLVPNPGFEEYTVCPGGYAEHPEEFHVKDWRPANAGTPDHFHSCSIGEADVPHNWAGVSGAYDGDGYIGLYAWMGNGIDYREYAQCKLITPLLKDSLYVIQFQYKLSSYSKFSIDRIGALLTDTVISWKRDRAPNVEPTFLALSDSALTERTGSWETGRWEFRAKGGEQYLTIGNFFDNARTHFYFIKFRDAQEVMLKDAAYYYVDGVELYSPFTQSNKGLIPAFDGDHVEFDKSFVLKNVQFEFDSYKLLSTSFNELDKVVAILLKYPKASIRLSGHTDDVGGERYNNKLSENRARTVAKYLSMQGIFPERIEISWYGKKRPMIDDNSDWARGKNRRVEISFFR